VLDRIGAGTRCQGSLREGGETRRAYREFSGFIVDSNVGDVSGVGRSGNGRPTRGGGAALEERKDLFLAVALCAVGQALLHLSQAGIDSSGSRRHDEKRPDRYGTRSE
jgi:hypothetical protein